MIPVKIVTKEQMEKILGKGCSCRGGGDNAISMGAIGNKATGKIIEVHRIDTKTGKKTVLFRDNSDPIFKKRKGGVK